MIPTLLTYLGMLLESDAGTGHATVSAIKLAAALAWLADAIALVLLWIAAAAMASRNTATSPNAVGKA